MIDLTKLVTAEVKEAKALAAVLASMETVRAQFRSDREGYLNRLSGIGFAAQIEGNTDVVDHVIAVRQGLLDLPAKPTVTAATTKAGLEHAMLVCYAQLLAGVPNAVKAAFREIGV